jgi:DNA repair protein RecO (recombination protein O)
MRTNFMFAKGKTIDIITQAELAESYPALREDLVRTTYASYIVELLDRFTVEEDPDQRKYKLLSDALGWLAVTKDLRLATRYYELRLLSLAGYQPQLFRCVSCGEQIEQEDQFFSADLGGLLNPDCQTVDRSARPISAVGVKVLRYLQIRDWETVSVLHLKSHVHSELEGLMHYYLRHILERDVKSIDFLFRLRREAALFISDGTEKPDEGASNGGGNAGQSDDLESVI